MRLIGYRCEGKFWMIVGFVFFLINDDVVYIKVERGVSLRDRL